MTSWNELKTNHLLQHNDSHGARYPNRYVRVLAKLDEAALISRSAYVNDSRPTRYEATGNLCIADKWLTRTEIEAQFSYVEALSNIHR